VRTLLGSCVAITLWHPKLHIGGMCHYLLPTRIRKKGEEPGSLNGRYASDAIQMFLREIHLSRTRPADYQVKLFGGGRMFTGLNAQRKTTGIGEKNVEFGKTLIAQYGFRLAAEDLGGTGHRHIMLDLWSGDVWVRSAKLNEGEGDANGNGNGHARAPAGVKGR
jgi:chemotaxis protein CheD